MDQPPMSADAKHARGRKVLLSATRFVVTTMAHTVASLKPTAMKHSFYTASTFKRARILWYLIALIMPQKS